MQAVSAGVCGGAKDLVECRLRTSLLEHTVAPVIANSHCIFFLLVSLI